MSKRILGASIGSCIHVAGVLNFLDLAEKLEYQTKFLGPAVRIDDLIREIMEYDPDIIGVSYRLTPENAQVLFEELKKKISHHGIKNKRWICGGTAPVCSVAEKSGLFERVFDGLSTMEDTISYLKHEEVTQEKDYYPQTLIERVFLKKPFPILRHHFGLPSLEETTRGIQRIAEAQVVDVISIAPDQNAQESFFRPEEMTEETGSGGVPFRRKEDLVRMYRASRRGNYPLLRCYSGTRDLMRMSRLLCETINNAWTATPLTWYSELDGRSARPLREAISENQENMRWNAERGIPVEVNEAHQWSLRNAHDTLAVVMAYLAAYNAKNMGVSTYVSQYMFNTPLGTSPLMDVAKMIAKMTLIESLHDQTFTSLRQVRVAGLLSYPVDTDYAMGQLAFAVSVGMAIHPDIVHCVSYSEADHAATPEDVIRTSKIARRVIQNCLMGMPDAAADPRVIQRKNQLLREAYILIDAIKTLGSSAEEPLTDPEVLEKAVRCGLLDAPQLKGSTIARGEVRTQMINGACYAVNEGQIMTEQERIDGLAEDVICGY
ncbi:MAG: methionine synthase [Theionarchaea archaeon]|nr:methionine synthase [Theionarchaea archaeon]MBU7001158.1 methionine synthase [Theionarchaea archaeon]MBU7019937.1 methionine synthase [Theionarchaea archaeon]MBU7034029.1 methionine synthase [Theionarchaea archaeon]MBU7039564.1 methionine synthase [Theionarchaea archaeon]